ncbi:MAG: hypothetical protein PT956_06170 [Firmicutes bacterium]|nr:hypothetical protein [Bacillota bacterium]
MAPILKYNLRAKLENRDDYKRFIPQKNYLQLINTSDGKAIYNEGEKSFYSRWAMQIKNYIDKKTAESRIKKIFICKLKASVFARLHILLT